MNKLEKKYTTYKEMHSHSIKNPREFWLQQSKKTEWYKQPTNILDTSKAPLYRWFTDGEVNISYNCLDIHAKKHPNKVALIYESPVAKETRKITY